MGVEMATMVSSRANIMGYSRFQVCQIL